MLIDVTPWETTHLSIEPRILSFVRSSVTIIIVTIIIIIIITIIVIFFWLSLHFSDKKVRGGTAVNQIWSDLGLVIGQSSGLLSQY